MKAEPRAEWRDVASLWPWRAVGRHEYVVDGLSVAEVRRERAGWTATIKGGMRIVKVFRTLNAAKGWSERNSKRPA